MLKLETIRVPGYKKVVWAEDPSSRLKCFIAVHSTALGPSLGGVRMHAYPGKTAAFKDALRLAKAMSYKASISGLNLGGGKAVLIGDPTKDKSRELFLSLGEAIEKLRGDYIAAEDSGILPADLDIVAKETSHVTGTGHGSGDPSPTTAWGVLEGMTTCARRTLGSPSLKGVTVAIQGVGQVGLHLAELLEKEGARLIIADSSRERLKLAEKTGAQIVDVKKIHKIPAGIFAPCALGSVLNAGTIREIQAKIVAGGANNQFEDEKKGPAALRRKKILHAPDYVINAGGLIRLYVREILKEKNLAPWIRKIGTTLDQIFEKSEKVKKPPLWIADQMAEERIRKKKKL